MIHIRAYCKKDRGTIMALVTRVSDLHGNPVKRQRTDHEKDCAMVRNQDFGMKSRARIAVERGDGALFRQFGSDGETMDCPARPLVVGGMASRIS